MTEYQAERAASTEREMKRRAAEKFRTDAKRDKVDAFVVLLRSVGDRSHGRLSQNNKEKLGIKKEAALRNEVLYADRYAALTMEDK